jgi:hypothetical protein
MSGFTTPEQVAAVSNALEYFEPLVCHLNRQMMLLGRLRSLLPILLLLAPPEKEGNQSIDQFQQFFNDNSDLNSRFHQKQKKTLSCTI